MIGPSGSEIQWAACVDDDRVDPREARASSRSAKFLAACVCSASLSLALLLDLTVTVLVDAPIVTCMLRIDTNVCA